MEFLSKATRISALALGIAGALATASLLVPAEVALKTVTGGRKSYLPRLFHRGLSRAWHRQTCLHLHAQRHPSRDTSG